MSSASTTAWPSQPMFMGIFALHNLEEILSIDRDTAFNKNRLEAVGFDTNWYRRDRMAMATGLLTALSHGLSRKLDNPTNTRQAFLGATVAGALGGNALSHLGRALAQRRYNGGLATSLVMLPAAVQVLRTVKTRKFLTGRQVVAATATGNALAVPMIVLALTAARRILK
jgi:Protein of unknown function with HXXEE motif